MVRFDDAGLAASADEDATRAHRADHWVLFEEDDRASLLKASLPELEWHRVGGCDALAFDDFLALALEGWAHLVPGTPTAPRTFGGQRPALAPLSAGWRELVRVAPSALWAADQRRGAWLRCARAATSAADASGVLHRERYGIRLADDSDWLSLERGARGPQTRRRPSTLTRRRRRRPRRSRRQRKLRPCTTSGARGPPGCAG